MKQILRKLAPLAAGLAMWPAFAQAAPPAQGDILLGFQATGGTGSNTNVLVNLGSATTLRDNPDPGAIGINVDAALDAAYGTDWFTRTDLWFGFIANLSNLPLTGPGAGAVTNGDPSSTIYVSRSAATAGAAQTWTGFNASQLTTAATSHRGQITMSASKPFTGGIEVIASSDSAAFANAWSVFNPFIQVGNQGAGFSIFGGGIQSNFGQVGTSVFADLQRILPTTGTGTYITTVAIENDGDIVINRTGAALSFNTLTRGTITGSGSVPRLVTGAVKYATGSTVSLVPTAASTHYFSAWTGAPGGDEGDNPLALVIDADKTIGATFLPKPVLTITAPTNGSITGATSGDLFNLNQVVNLTAVPATNYHFVSWSETPGATSAANPLAVTMSVDKTVSATFALNPQLTITAPTNGSISGATSGDFFVPGTVANLTATANAGYKFSTWTVTPTAPGLTVSPLALTMTADTTVSAVFVPDNADTDGDGISNFDELFVHFTDPAIANTVPALPGNIVLESTVTGLPGAEISAFDPASARLFVTSGAGLSVVDLSNPAAPVTVATIDMSAAPISAVSNDVSSVSVSGGKVAVAILNANKEAAGEVVFLDAATATTAPGFLSKVTVGNHPDHVIFTPDGLKVLVANEGEYLFDPDGSGSPGVGAAGNTPGSVSIISVAGFSVQTVGFTAFDGQETTLRTAGVRIYAGQSASLDLEPENIAVSPDGTKAMVTMQEANAVAILDIATASFDSIVSQGAKDFSTLLADFSDRDGPANGQVSRLTTGNPVFGLYMADGIASFTQGGTPYFIMANEGDDRNDVNLATDTDTVRVSALDLDDTLFPTESTLKTNAVLGRLTVLNKGEDGLAQTTPINKLLSLGGRSFSIRSATGALVYDSGDLIEKTIATYGKNDGSIAGANTRTDAIADDTRSDNKAAEPEGVAVSTINGQVLAFVTLERANGVLVFNITNVISNPASVSVVAFLRGIDDVSPEGVIVVPAADSPNNKALVVVSNEGSPSPVAPGTVSVFSIDVPLQTLTVTPPVNGSVNGLAVGGAYAQGETATLTAVAASGYRFTGWTGDVPNGNLTSNPLQLVMDADRTVAATFTQEHTVTLSATTNGSITGLALNGIYLNGTNASLTAVPATGFVFSAWTGASTSTTNPLTLLVDGPKTVGATFIADAGDGDGNGFSVFEETRLAALLTNFTVGDSPTIDLSFFSGTISVTGLPKGLVFNPTLKTISGIITGELSDAPVVIRRGIGAAARSIEYGLIVSPFSLLGSFEALIEESGMPVGKARLTVTGPKAFSATLELQGQALRSVKGAPAGGGNVTSPFTVAFPAGRNNVPVATSVTFVVSPSSDLVSGDNGVGRTLRGFRLAKAGRSPIQRVTVALEAGSPGNGTATPGGSGYATGSLTSAGLLSLTGALGDAVAFKAGLNLSQTNQAVVFLQPYKDKTKSFFGGIITIGNLGQPGRGGSSQSQTAGLQWRKFVLDAASATELAYPQGFGNVDNTDGSAAAPLVVNGRVGKWVSVSSAEGLALSLGLDLREINLSYIAPSFVGSPVPVYPTKVALRNTFSLVRIAPTNSVAWSCRATPSTGAFAGNLTLPAPAAKSAVNGVFLQDETFLTQVGVGLVRIPIAGIRGAYQTAGIRFDN